MNKSYLQVTNLEFFYRVLHLCETDKKLKGFAFNRKWVNIWTKGKNPKITLNPVTIIDENRLNLNENTITYKKAYRNSKRLSEPASLLVRLRNSFAHCRIELQDGVYTMYDYYLNKCTMYGKVDAKT